MGTAKRRATSVLGGKGCEQTTAKVETMTLDELYQCDYCNEMLTESEANVEPAQGYREVIVLAFCDGCWDE